MSRDDIEWTDAGTLRERIVAGEVSAEEATRVALDRAERVGPRLRAFIALDRAGALKRAREADRALREGRQPGALQGVPVTLKDLVATKGLPMTAGSRALGAGRTDDPDAPLVRRLRRAGAVLIGKTNLNELAYGVTGENHHFGAVLNPWDPSRMPGGSSGGSAAALAAGIGYASVGTDTRGSIRIPAACCAISGLKPTRGAVPTEGVFPLSWTLDHAGPMARTAADLALLLGVMADGTAARRRYREATSVPVEGLRVGIPGYFMRDLDEEVEAHVRAALDVLADVGLEPVPMEVGELEDNLPASAAITAAESLAVHDERLRAGREGFGPPVLARLEAGYALTAVDLARAEAVRRALIAAYDQAFERVDCMAGPTLPGLPAPVGGTSMRVAGGREEGVVDASVRLVAPQNMTGVPAVSVPCGFSRGGLPVSLQVWAPAGRDDVALAVAHAFQARTDWHRRRPDLGWIEA